MLNNRFTPEDINYRVNVSDCSVRLLGCKRDSRNSRDYFSLFDEVHCIHNGRVNRDVYPSTRHGTFLPLDLTVLREHYLFIYVPFLFSFLQK